MRGAFVALLCVASGLLTGCSGWDTAPLETPPALPAAILVDVTAMSSTDGRPDWVLRAPVAEGDPNAGLDVRAPRLDVFNADGTPGGSAEAGQARINRLTQDVSARGGVRLRGSDGLVVVTDSLQMLGGAQRLVTAARVTLERHGSRLSGVGFDSDASLKTYRILGQLQAHVIDTSGDFHVD